MPVTMPRREAERRGAIDNIILALLPALTLGRGGLRVDARGDEPMRAALAIAATLLALPAWAEDCTPTPRMPVEQSQAIKRSMLPPGGEMRDFELDHIIPLCAGGSNDRSNLQMQPWPEAKRKDVVEIRVCQALRQRRIGCAEARKMIDAWKP